MTDTWSMPSGSGDSWADDYERGRPGWPAEIVHIGDVPSTSTVLDLGAGTGKLTRVLTPAFECVVAVEPAAPMRAHLLRVHPEARTLAGTAEAIPLPDASVDAVYVGQAFHTFDAARALQEIARVLRARGVLLLLWNRPGGPWQPSAAAAEEILAERMPAVDYIPLDLGGPDAASGWQPPVSDSRFGPFEATALPNPQSLDREGLVAFYATMGWIGDLPDDERLPLLARVRSSLDAASYTRVWETHVHIARLR